jgi:hypothetical protein
VALQHLRIEKPFFSLLSKRPERVAYVLEVPPLGFGYPFGGVSLFNPWKSLSTPNALGLRPSELSSYEVIQGTFPYLVSALALSYQTLSA